MEKQRNERVSADELSEKDRNGNVSEKYYCFWLSAQKALVGFVNFGGGERKSVSMFFD